MAATLICNQHFRFTALIVLFGLCPEVTFVHIKTPDKSHGVVKITFFPKLGKEAFPINKPPRAGLVRSLNGETNLVKSSVHPLRSGSVFD